MALIRSLVLFLALLLPAVAHADAEPIHIDYRADAGCPSEAEFRRQVFARTASARLAQQGEPGRIFTVELRRAAGRVTGSLTIRQPDGETMARRVSAESCSDIAMVLALASALAIDPQAQLAPEQRLDADSPMNDDAAFSSDRESSTSVDSGVAWGYGGALGPRAMLGVTPQPALGAALVLDAHAADPNPLALSLGLAFLQTPTERVQTATARFRIMSLRPEVCPARLGSHMAVRGYLCLGVELGAMSGSGGEIANPATRTLFWGAAAGSARVDVPLGEPWYLVAEAGVLVPFTRYRFVFEGPETTVHSVSSVAGSGTLRVGLRF